MEFKDFKLIEHRMTDEEFYKMIKLDNIDNEKIVGHFIGYIRYYIKKKFDIYDEDLEQDMLVILMDNLIPYVTKKEDLDNPEGYIRRCLTHEIYGEYYSRYKYNGICKSNAKKLAKLTAIFKSQGKDKMSEDDFNVLEKLTKESGITIVGEDLLLDSGVLIHPNIHHDIIDYLALDETIKNILTHQEYVIFKNLTLQYKSFEEVANREGISITNLKILYKNIINTLRNDDEMNAFHSNDIYYKKQKFYPIKNLENYFISKNGDVYKYDNGKRKLIKGEIHNNEKHFRVKGKRYKIAKLMLNTFVEENNIKKIVYIDGDINNLKLENLQYKKQRRVEVTLPDGEIHIIDSEDLDEVVKRYKVKRKSLIKCLNGFTKMTEGYRFKYIV